MYGAILGDMVGAPYEYDMSEKRKDFPMWIDSSRKTDDTVMTIAVAEALLDTRRKSNAKIKKALIKSMKKYGELYSYEGYGTRFSWWLKSNKNIYIKKYVIDNLAMTYLKLVMKLDLRIIM